MTRQSRKERIKDKLNFRTVPSHEEYLKRRLTERERQIFFMALGIGMLITIFINRLMQLLEVLL